MTRLLLLAASVAALSVPAFGQSFEVPTQLAHHGYVQDEQILLDKFPIHNSEDIIVIGKRIGGADTDALIAPSSLLTDEDIELRGADYVTDLLRALPGIAISSSGGAGQLTQIRMRGSEANHVLVLIDGIEMSNPSDGAFNFAGLTTDNIARVEVLRGEQSALYGSDAIGGVINIITKNGIAQSSKLYSLRIGTGTLSTLDGAASARFGTDELTFTLSGNALETDGFDISPVGDEKDGHESQNINLGVTFTSIDNLTLSGKYGLNKLSSDFDSFPQFGSSADVLDIETETMRLSADYDGEVLDHLISASRQTTETESYGSNSIGEQDQISWAANWQGGKHDLTGLLEAEWQSYKIGSSLTGENDSQSAVIDYSFTATDALRLTASARHDLNSLFDDQTTWRLGGNYQLANIDGHFRATVGTGVKNPTLIELFGYTPGASFTNDANETVASFIGNDALQAETSLGFNIGYVHNFAKGFASIDYFKSDLENEIYTVFGSFGGAPNYARLSADSVANRDTDSTREGVELEGQWEPTETLSLTASSTFLQSEENGTDEQRRPEFLASLGVNWQASDVLDINLTANHTGDQLDTDFGSYQSVTLPAYTLVSFNGRVKVNDIFTASMRAENLLDEDYQEVFGYESAPRTVYLGLSADF